jgi:pSer/pThr/pTyr-binding forkhead associated (FHA) protein
MTEKTSLNKRGVRADWLMRGVLTKLGDSFDKLTGRKWTPSSSLAASELIERIKKLLDAEAKEVPGKGTVVPHNINLKVQWNKFSEDVDLNSLEVELLTAAVDHINDSLYYTYAPVTLVVKPDYFIEGVKLAVSFDEFAEDEGGVEMNVTVPAMNVAEALSQLQTKQPAGDTYIFRYEIKGEKKEKRLEFSAGHPQSVGRIGANGLMLDDQSVSKTHASLAVAEDGSLSVADTGSTNGTFINDERIAYGKAVPLTQGDKVRFGTVEVSFEHVPPPVVIEQEPAPEQNVEETVSIDGFEFKRRVSPEFPEDDADETAAAIAVPPAAKTVEASDRSPAISMPAAEVPADVSDTSPAIVMPGTPVVRNSAQRIDVPDETLKMDDEATETSGNEAMGEKKE